MSVRTEPYQGKFISDGLERYDDIAAELKLLHFGCLQHCRTMFFKARKVSQLPSSRTLANAAMVDYIRPVYQVEERIKALREEYAARGEILPLEAVLGAAPGEVQAHPGEVQGLGR